MGSDGITDHMCRDYPHRCNDKSSAENAAQLLS
jgi:hypothetical protein